MHSHTIKARTFLALAGLAFAAVSPLHSAMTYTDGDLLLGFRATGGTGANNNIIVNLGTASQFTNLAPGQSIVLDTEIGNLKAELDAYFSANWQTRVEMLWSVSGVQKAAGNGFVSNTMFATNAQTGTLQLGLQNSTAWTRPNAFGAGTPALKIQAFGERFKLGDGDGTPTGSVESTNSAVTLIQQANGINSYTSFMPNGANTTGATAFAYFGGAAGIEGNFGTGTGGVILDFYTVAPGSGAAAYEGTFSIDNNANVTFTAAVPEPSSIAALLAGFAVLGGIRRRKARP